MRAADSTACCCTTGCSIKAFRSIAGYGRHGLMHEQQFFELAGELPVITEFVVSDIEADQILAALRKEKIDVVYARWPAEFSATGSQAAD